MSVLRISRLRTRESLIREFVIVVQKAKHAQIGPCSRTSFVKMQAAHERMLRHSRAKSERHHTKRVPEFGISRFKLDGSLEATHCSLQKAPRSLAFVLQLVIRQRIGLILCPSKIVPCHGLCVGVFCSRLDCSLA